MPKLSLVLFGWLLATAASSAAAPPPEKGDPLKGVVLGGDVFYCDRNAGIATDVYVHPLRKDRPTRGRWCSYAQDVPIRWQVGHGAFWVSYGLQGVPRSSLPSLGTGCLLRFDLRLLYAEDVKLFGCEGTLFTGGPPDLSPFHAFDERYFMHCDSLPAGDAKARHFTLTNLTSDFDDRNKEFEKGKTPASKFFCDLAESRRDPKDEDEWKERSWKREWTAPVAFKEPFQALGLGDDYYFVTRSGSLFRAAKPAKGTDRVLARVWDGENQPIKAFVSDAATGKTFLFVTPAKADGKPAFFELSPKPKLKEYDPKAVPMPKLEEPHRTIVHAARILVALKKIKVEPSPAPGAK